VEAAFDGGLVSSDAGALLLGATDRAIGLIDRFAACFHDERREDLIEHEVVTLVGQRVFGIALGYEDLNDHDELRHDPLMAVLAGKLAARREDCAPVAGKSTLNRLELSKLEPTRYHKISHNPVAINNLLVDQFVEAHARPPKQIILDLDATDDPLHGEQEGRFFHGYYDCYCYLPLYVFCGRHLLVAKLRSADMDAAAGAVEEVARVIARIRARWPWTRILLRADSGFAREDLMAWCEGNGVDFLFGLARNERLVAEIVTELDLVAAKSRRSGRGERRFKSFMWTTRRTWSRRRRVVAKAEWTKGEANPRFVVTSLRRDECKAKYLYEKVYCARGEMENRIKECQLDLYADRTSAATMRANQLRLWFYSMAICCSAPCAASGCAIPTSPTPPAAPSVSSCSRSEHSCASASAASRLPWHRPARPRKIGDAPQSGSQSLPSPAPPRHDTRCPGAIIAGATHRPTEIQKIADIQRLRRHEHSRRWTSIRQNRLTRCPILSSVRNPR
jgi:hypothetical protein